MTPETLPGQIVAERYLVETLLGQGGMGAVFRARHVETRQPVALKVVLPGPARLRLVSRFMREARLSARLHHPHVVRVLDYGRWGAEREHGYLTMELVDGVSLERLLDAGLSVGTACELARQVLTALAHVHARGVLHRDIKPDNVLVTRRADGLLVAQLTDFGLAYALTDDDASEGTRLTHDGTVLGTPAYMAPEQVGGHNGLGPATDLYAVGVILYRLLSGRLPYTGDTMQMLLARLHRPPDPLIPRAGTELSPLLDAMVAKLLARHPEERFALAADVLAELAPLAQPEPLAPEDWQHLSGSAVSALADTDQTQLDVARSRITLADLEPGVARDARDDLEQLWGREREQGELDALAARAETGEGQLVLLMGEVGIGKTALAELAAVSLNEIGRFRVLRARATPGGGGGALGAVRAALDALLDTHGRPAAVVERAVRAMLTQHGDEDETEVAGLVALLRPEARPELRLETRQALAAFVRMLRRLARVRPVLVLLDDLEHDATTAALVELVVFELTLDPFPLLALVPLRPVRSEVAVRDALARTVRAEGRVRRVLELGPLPAELLAEGLEARLGLSPQLARFVARRAGGNPLFARHLAAAEPVGASMLETRSLHTHASSSTSSLPEVLRALLETSLAESLGRTPEPARARALLEQVAVLGEHVEIALLEALLEPEAARALDDDLDALIDVGLLHDAGPEAVAFANALLAPVVLAGLGPRRLRRMHQRAAELRRGLGDASALGPIGDHLAAAGNLTDAIEAWLQAHARAELLGLAEESARWGHKALSALDPADPRAASCALAVARTLRAEADLESAMTLLEPLRHAADPDLVLQAGELVAEIHQERVDFDAWEAQVAALDTHFDAAGPRGRAAALRARAFLFNMSRRFAESKACVQAALELGSDDALASVSALTRMVWSSISLGALDDARAQAQHALELAGARLDLHADATRLLMLVHAHAGEVDAMREVGTRMLEAQRRAGRVARRVSANVDLAMGFMMNELADEARVWAVPATSLAERFGLMMELVRIRLISSGCELLQGDPDAALRVLDEPIVQGAFSRDVPLFRTVRAWGLALSGRSAEALVDLGRFDLDAQPSSRIVAVAYLHLGAALLEGAPEAARHVLAASRVRWQRLGDADQTARTGALLGEP